MWKPNVTVAAVIARDGRFLFVEEQTGDGVCINQPAGHLDPGESLLDAVVRETFEETCHRFKPTALLGVYLVGGKRGVTYLRFAFTGELGEREDGRALDHGILRTLWLTPDELRERDNHRSALVTQCVDDYLAGQRVDLNALYTHPSALA